MTDKQVWLDDEYGGYPSEKGRIPQDAWEIGAKHKRTYREKDKNGKSSEYMFTELCGELESLVTDRIAGTFSFREGPVSGGK